MVQIPRINANRLFGPPISRDTIIWANAYKDPRYATQVRQHWIAPAVRAALQAYADTHKPKNAGNRRTERSRTIVKKR